MQMRSARRERQVAEHHALRDKGAEAVGPLLAIVRDADPVQLFLPEFDPGEVVHQVGELQNRWRPVRDRLFVYGAAHPSGAVVGSTQKVAASIDTFLVDLRIAATGQSGSTPEGASESYTGVSFAVAELIAEIRGEPLHLGPARDLKDE